MAKSIITLGIGGAPDSLTPFITGGLFLQAEIELVGMCVSFSGRTMTFVMNGRAAAFELNDRTAVFLLAERRAEFELNGRAMAFELAGISC